MAASSSARSSSDRGHHCELALPASAPPPRGVCFACVTRFDVCAHSAIPCVAARLIRICLSVSKYPRAPLGACPKRVPAPSLLRLQARFRLRVLSCGLLARVRAPAPAVHSASGLSHAPAVPSPSPSSPLVIVCVLFPLPLLFLRCFFSLSRGAHNRAPSASCRPWTHASAQHGAHWRPYTTRNACLSVPSPMFTLRRAYHVARRIHRTTLLCRITSSHLTSPHLTSARLDSTRPERKGQRAQPVCCSAHSVRSAVPCPPSSGSAAAAQSRSRRSCARRGQERDRRNCFRQRRRETRGIAGHT